ncbi:hypothetical protein [Microscilla marina]|uniref:Uncharacterized protein n=1 Tax=Microscilla marina ATCC 23134 TaxID=313606 RepID=A1ZGF3_MICM2|nr:hypothetical protein [Microscilla marina]EAY30570.1 hypothetical protein M23134_03208 [Microscilla marina ATCC 23134]
MQGTNFFEVAQSPYSLDWFEQGIRARLEHLSLSADTPLEHYSQTGQSLSPDNIEKMISHLELRMLEMSYLINELKLLQKLKTDVLP